MTTEHICIMIAIIVYLGAMLYVGYRCSKNNHDTTDFYLGGRKLGPLVTAMSAEASDMSSWLLMGLPGLAYLTGIADAGWTAIGLAIGTYINWRIVAKRIRRYTLVAGNSITLPSFFSNRYRDQRKILQSIGAIFIVIFFIPYTASGFAACGKLFSSLFGVNYVAAMIISAIVIVGYTALGGFLAASTTDFIQSIIMSVALIIVFIFGIVSFAWAGFGAVFGPVVLFALFWRRSNWQGALAGMISGGAMVFIWKYLVRPLGGVWNIYELLPAFSVSCLMIVIVSLLTKAPSKEITEEFDRV